MDIIEKIKNKKVRGYLTIKRRIIFEGAIYHITQRAPGRELVFIENNDYLKFLSLLKETTKKFNLDLFCFALLPNHLHLLIRINEKNLPVAMGYLFQVYAIYFNNKYQRKGHVFCGRYRSSLCNDDAYLLAALSYIHLNPYKAGLIENFNKYRWSSLRIYLKNTKGSFVKSEEILLLLDEDINRAKRKYKKILEESAGIPGGNLINAESINSFIEKVKRITRKFYREESDIDAMIEKFRKEERVKNPEEKTARKYLIQQLLASKYKVSEICELLDICKKTYYNILNYSADSK